MNMKASFLSLILLQVSLIGQSQTPNISWQNTFGGSQHDRARSVNETNDGGYIIAGVTRSPDGDVSGSHGANFDDFWVVKTNAAGALQWQRALGGSQNDIPHSIQQTSDGGYIVTGVTESNDGDVSGNHGSGDIWVVKLNSVGNISWGKTYGGSGYDVANSIKQTPDGGYIIAGSTTSSNGDVSFMNGIADYWVLKLTDQGVISWEKTYGGSHSESAQSIDLTADGGYVIVGFSESINGDVSGNHGSSDFWLVKLTSLGTIEWEKSFGGSNSEIANGVRQTPDKGYIIGGFSKSSDGNVSAHIGSTFTSDYWIVKTDSIGTLEWEKTYGGTDEDWLQQVNLTTDGGYFIVGYSKSTDVDVNDNHGSFGRDDIFVLKLGTTGNVTWKRCIGGSQYERSTSGIQAGNGDFIVVGNAGSVDGDLAGWSTFQGGDDFWIVALDGTVDVQDLDDHQSSVIVSPNPSSGIYQFHDLNEKNRIEIYDSMGKLALETLTIGSQTQIDLTHARNGIYFYNIFSGDRNEAVKSGKLIKRN